MRGTTPEIQYELPFSADMVAKAKIVIKHGDTVLIKKNTADCRRSGNRLTVKLTRAETVQLPDDTRVCVQLEVETAGGDSLVTAPESVYTGSLLDEGALL